MKKLKNSKDTGLQRFSRNDGKKGFTLVELVIVIAIVIILSVVSVPIYRGYVDKAMISEGYGLLGMILSAEKAYYSEYGNFYHTNTVWTCNESTLGVDARSNKYFTYFYIGSNFNSAKFYVDAVVKKPLNLATVANRGHLVIRYNITLGSQIMDYPADFDDSWKQA